MVAEIVRPTKPASPFGIKGSSPPTIFPTKDPASPSRIVIINPPGSFPGIKNLPRAPAINPTINEVNMTGI